MRAVFRFLLKQRGDWRWDILLRATGIAALLGIPIVIVFPSSVPLVWLVLVGIPSNGPLSPLLPTAFEPLMMEAAKYHGPLLVTVVAETVYLYMEYINWYVYAWVLNWDKLTHLRDKRWVRWGVKRFARAPFATVLFFAITPIPFWIVRCLGILHQYSLTRYMVATAVGRFPRLFVYAWVGSAIHIPTTILVGVALGTGVLVVAWRLLSGKRILQDTVFDMAPTPAPAPRPSPDPSAPVGGGPGYGGRLGPSGDVVTRQRPDPSAL